MAITNKWQLILVALIFAVTLISWEYFTGGVATHYLLADSSNPGISNWWALVTFPLLTWVALILIGKRRPIEPSESEKADKRELKTNYLIGGLVFGSLASLLWELGAAEQLQYVMLLPLVLALFVRIYLPETTLGFVLGMSYAFGGVLPVAVSIVLQTVGFLLYLVFNRGGKLLMGKAA